MKSNGRLFLCTSTVMALVAVFPARAQFYRQTNLVSNRGDVGAEVVDLNLKNPWGVSHSPTSPFWVSDQVTNVSTLYSVDPTTGAVAIVPLVVSVPGGPHGTGVQRSQHRFSHHFRRGHRGVGVPLFGTERRDFGLEPGGSTPSTPSTPASVESSHYAGVRYTRTRCVYWTGAGDAGFRPASVCSEPRGGED